MFKTFVSFNMESFKYNVFESKSLFSEFYHSRHGFFHQGPPFQCLARHVPDVIQFYNYYPIKAQIRSLRMVTVASDFLIMLNGKWSSQKFQDEQINEKFGVAFSDGDICIFCYNINVESIPSQPYQIANTDDFQYLKRP